MLTASRLAQNTLRRIERNRIANAPLEMVDNTPASLKDFTLATYQGEYRVNWHHELMMSYLEKFARGEIKRLIINAPPRHGKSELVSRRLPAYLLGLYPDAQIISCSYSAELASRTNRDVQRIIDHGTYKALFPQTALFGDNIRTVSQGTYLRNSDMFEIVGHNGSYRSAGIGGGIGGMGFHFGIIDDPIKNRKEANSPTVRKAIMEWYTSTFYTRQEKDASILITMTRFHKDDLVGKVTEADEDTEDNEGWTILNIPAIAEGILHPDDPREEGEALWPFKYPIAKLRRIRKTLAEFEFSAQYQGKPIPTGGVLFNVNAIGPQNIVDTVPECTRVVRFYDLAATKKKSSDYTAGVKMGLTKDQRPVILDVYRAQEKMPDIQNAIATNAAIDGKEVSIRLEAEKAGIIELDYLLRDPRMLSYNLSIKPPEGDKFTRATPFATRVNNGHFLMVRASWNRALIDEMSSFPFAGHDDQIDACSGAYDMLAGNVGTEFLFEVDNEGDYDE